MIRSIPAHLTAAFAITAIATILMGCGAAGKFEPIRDRVVPYPLEVSETRAATDSVERAKWRTRAIVPDPLAGGDDGPRLVIEAVLYGKDLIAAEIAETCMLDSLADEACEETMWDEYRSEHRPDSLLRIQLNLRSTFSINSLDTRFWDIYLRGHDGIMHEPVTVKKHEPVAVREDKLPEPGRVPVHAGLYTRDVDLYFFIRTPFGATVLGPDIGSVVLVLSRSRRELAALTWRIQGIDAGDRPGRTGRRGASKVDF